MPDWLIKIVSVTPTNMDDPTAAFLPTTQQCLSGDNITWKNQTDDEHQPWPLGPDGKPAATGWGVNPVAPGTSSNPTYSVATSPKGIVKYCCKKHTSEVGELDVLTAPPTF